MFLEMSRTAKFPKRLTHLKQMVFHWFQETSLVGSVKQLQGCKQWLIYIMVQQQISTNSTKLSSNLSLLPLPTTSISSHHQLRLLVQVVPAANRPFWGHPEFGPIFWQHLTSVAKKERFLWVQRFLCRPLGSLKPLIKKLRDDLTQIAGDKNLKHCELSKSLGESSRANPQISTVCRTHCNIYKPIS